MTTGKPTESTMPARHAHEDSLRENLGCLFRCAWALALSAIIVAAVPVTMALLFLRDFGGRWKTDILHAEDVDEVTENRWRAAMLAKVTDDVDLPDSAHDISLASRSWLDSAAIMVCHGDVNELRDFLKSLAKADNSQLIVLNPRRPRDIARLDRVFLHPPSELLAALPPWKNVRSGKRIEYYAIGGHRMAALDRDNGVLYIH